LNGGVYRALDVPFDVKAQVAKPFCRIYCFAFVRVDFQTDLREFLTNTFYIASLGDKHIVHIAREKDGISLNFTVKVSKIQIRECR
jgi:hypothetical protein